VQYCIVVHIEITAAPDMCLRVPFHIQSPPETVDDQRRRDVAVWTLWGLISFVHVGGSSMAEVIRKQGHKCAPIISTQTPNTGFLIKNRVLWLSIISPHVSPHARWRT
jgi:hypothetical protein